jgi:hypothetical protein
MPKKESIRYWVVSVALMLLALAIFFGILVVGTLQLFFD